MTTTDTLIVEVIITNGDNNKLTSGSFYSGTPWQSPISSSFTNGTLCVYLTPQSGNERNLWV